MQPCSANLKWPKMSGRCLEWLAKWWVSPGSRARDSMTGLPWKSADIQHHPTGGPGSSKHITAKVAIKIFNLLNQFWCKAFSVIQNMSVGNRLWLVGRQQGVDQLEVAIAPHTLVRTFIKRGWDGWGSRLGSVNPTLAKKYQRGPKWVYRLMASHTIII